MSNYQNLNYCAPVGRRNDPIGDLIRELESRPSNPDANQEAAIWNNHLGQMEEQSLAPPHIPLEPADYEWYQEKFCPACVVSFETTEALDRHLFAVHSVLDPQVGGGQQIEPQVAFTETQSAINGMFVTYHASLADMNFKNIGSLFRNAQPSATTVLKQEIQTRKNIRVIITVKAEFSRMDPSTGEEERLQGEDAPSFTSLDHVLMNPHSISKVLTMCMNQIAFDVEQFLQNGSGWVLDRVDQLIIKISSVNSIKGSSYMELPPLLKRKTKTLLNIKNNVHTQDDDHLKCFAWSCLAHPHFCAIPENSKYEREKAYANKLKVYKPHLHKLNLDGITFPMTLNQVPKFEAQNPKIGITVIAYEMDDAEDYNEEIYEESDISIRKRWSKYDKIQDKIREKLYPCYVCPEDRPVKIDLLLLIAPTNEGGMRPDHFVYIKSLTSLLQSGGNHKTRDICRNCLQNFRTQRTLREHQKYCPSLRLQRTDFPKLGKNTLKFKNWHRTQKAPFIIFADFESQVPKCDEEMHGKSQHLQKHKVCGYSWIAIDHHGNRYSSNCWHAHDDNEDVAQRFLMEIMEECERLRGEMANYKRKALEIMTMDEETARNFSLGILPNEKCCFCKKKCKIPVRHHSHLPPYEFIGMACNQCNISASISDTITVVFHNFGAYDNHFIIQALSNEIAKEFEIVGKTSEKFLSILLNKNIRFIDSVAFFPQSLEALVEQLLKDQETFKPLLQEFSNIKDPRLIEMLLKKQPYPYSYIDSVNRFWETSLPPPKAFHNDLKNEPISAEDYQHIEDVWKAFELQDLGDLHDLYVRLDSALLACCFEANRSTMLKQYGLDIAHYLSLPMVTKDALLKKTEVELELLTDPTMYCWFEQNIRGGLVSVGSLRAAQANNKYMGAEYNENLSTSFIQFLDANNQYGYALSQPLPEKDFKWVEGKELERIERDPVRFIMNLEVDCPTGYAFEVDLEVPEELHDYFNDLPPAPTKRTVEKEELSLFQRNLLDGSPPAMLKSERLIADLLPKKNMGCHYRNLQLWLRLGCRLTWIHSVIKFTQSRWMKAYIDFNTDLRKLALSDIEVAFYKALNNMAFGKMIERLRDRQSIVPIRTDTRGRRYNKKPTVADFKIIHPDLVLLMMKKLAAYLNNPIAVGFTCLELSKLVTYEFHYDYMKRKFGNMARLCYTDTDSLVYHIEYPNKDGDIYKDFAKDNHFFDMSDYKRDHPIWNQFYDASNKKVLGKMKDEFANKVITHIVAPKPKMYCVRFLQDGKDKISGAQLPPVGFKKKAKGLGKKAVQNKLIQENYVQALVGDVNPDITMKTIRSFNHVVYTIQQDKKSVSGLDVKRFCLPDFVSTLGFGHKDIPLYQ